jgi:transposase
MGTSRTPNKPSADVLRREYWDDRLSTIKLSEKYGVSFGTIWQWLKAYGIPIAPKGYHRFKDSRKPLTCAVDGCQNQFSVILSKQEKYRFCETHRRMNPPRLPDQYIPTVIEQYASGKTTPEIGREMGYAASHIRKVLKKAGITLRDPNARHYKTFDKKKIVQQYENGQSIASIAKELHTCATKITEILKNHPLFIQRHAPRPYPFEDAVRLYVEDHEPISWLSRRYKVPHQRIVADFRAHNIPMRNRKTHWKHGIKCIDGHMVFSYIERRVDDWLYSHGLLHAYEPDLPAGMSGTADFLVGTTYIEVWGMEKNSKYRQRKQQKIASYEANNLSYISIYADDVRYTLDLLLAPLLQPSD